MLGRTPPDAMVTPPSSCGQQAGGSCQSLYRSGGLFEKWVLRKWPKSAKITYLVELLIVADGQLHVARDDAGLLVVAGGVAGELKDLGAQVLEDRGEVDRGASSDAGRGALQVAVDAAHRELEPGLGAAGLGSRLGSLLSASALSFA